VPVTVVDLAEIVKGELAENIHRKDFLPSEIDAIRRVLEPAEKAAAKQRMSEGGKGAKVSQPSRAVDKIGAFAGISGRTVEKIAAVVAAAEADPTLIPFVKRMDASGRVNGVYRQLKVAQQAERIRSEMPPLPGRGPYRVLVVDPPWRHEPRPDDLSQRGKPPYPMMTVEQISALPIASIAHKDALLWLWTTNYHLVSGQAL
jgi:MT-A70